MDSDGTAELDTRTDYGIDAPGLVRGMFAGGAALAAVATGVGLWAWPGGGWAWAVVAVAGLGAVYGIGMGCYMLYGSRVGKVRERHRLLDLVPWSGREAVLDVGCGRGLLLVAAAGRVPEGRAVGIDVWQATDQTGNRPDAARANARAEGVGPRVEVRTADMRELPFTDASFDLVVSHWAVHNLYARDERSLALAEMARVLHPGGHVLLADIEYHAEYAARFIELGLCDVRHVYSPWRDRVLRTLTFGSFRPGTVLARRPG